MLPAEGTMALPARCHSFGKCANTSDFSARCCRLNRHSPRISGVQPNRPRDRWSGPGAWPKELHLHEQ